MLPSKPPGENRGDVPFLLRFIATGFFAGYIPWASGTFGSLVALLIYAIPGAEHPVIQSLLIVVSFAVGVPAAAHVAAAEGHRLTASAAATKAIFQPRERHHSPDPSIVVVDEMLGMWLALFLLPKTLIAAIVAFVLFRAMDVVKPPPARQAEQFGNGWGIMLDDAVAGVYANLLTRVVLFLLFHFTGVI